MNFLFIRLALVLAVTLLLPGDVLTADTIRIGLTLGLTGKYSIMANMQMKGYRLWEEDVNRRGGILKRKVQIIVYDDMSDPRTAGSLYERMIETEQVDLVFGPYSSEIAESILPVTEKHGYPVLLAGAIADRLWQKGYRYVFGMLTPASKMIVGFLEMTVKQGLSDIAILHADDSYSRDIADGARKWAGRFGLKVVLFEGFTKGTRNLDEHAKKAKAAKAQVVIVCGHFIEAVDMRLSLKKIGWYPNAYYASVGPAEEAFYDRLKKDAENVFSSSHWERGTPFHPKICGEFCRKFEAAYRREPSYFAANAFAAGQILESAINELGTLDREKVRDTLSKMDATTVVGRYGVDKTGMQTKHFSLTIQWQGGKKEIVWPEELMTAKPRFQ